MRRPRSSLFLASFLMLFVELALIRGTTAAVVYLSFFTNLVLLASFLGIGLGFLRARGDRDPLRWTPLLLAGVLLFVLLFPVRIGRAVDRVPELLGIGRMHALPEWLSLSLIFLGVVAVMTVIAERVGRLFAAFAPLDAYRLDILGSICGVVVFSALAFVDAGPLVWIVVAIGRAALPASGRAHAVRRGEPRGAAGARRGQLAAASRHLVAVPTRDVRATGRRSGVDPRQQPPAPDHGAALAPARRTALLRLPVRPSPRRSRRRADRRGGQRQRRGAGPVEGSDARRRRGDRPRAAAVGKRPAPGASVPGPTRERAHRRRPSVPGADPRPLRPDPVRAARLAHAGVGAGRRSGSRATSSRRRRCETVRDHLRPGGAFSMYNYYRSDVFERYADHAHAGVRPRAVHRSRRTGRDHPLPVGAHDRSRTGFDRLRHAVRRAGRRAGTRDRRPSVPVPAWPSDPLAATSSRSRSCCSRRSSTVRVGSGRPLRRDAPLRRPVLHGRGVPAARDEERRAVRAPVRHHVVRELARVRGDPRSPCSAPSRWRVAPAARPAPALRRCSRASLVGRAGSSGRSRSCRWSRSRGSSPRSRWRSRRCSWRT